MQSTSSPCKISVVSKPQQQGGHSLKTDQSPQKKKKKKKRQRRPVLGIKMFF
jgi:hypothetical protein